MDEITLTGVRATGYHGVYEHERREGQEFVVDVVVRLPLDRPAVSDDVTDTIHYGELAERIVAAVERDPLNLIEALAERIAHEVLSYPLVASTTVTVHKPHAPIPVPFEDVAVTIHRPVPA